MLAVAAGDVDEGLAAGWLRDRSIPDRRLNGPTPAPCVSRWSRRHGQEELVMRKAL